MEYYLLETRKETHKAMQFTCLMSEKDWQLAVNDGTMDKEQSQDFLPLPGFPLQVSPEGRMQMWVRARRWSSWKPCPSSQSWIPGACWAAPMAVSLEVTQKLPGPANLFLSQIISLAKTLTRNCTLNWGGNGCQRWSAYPFPFLRETTFVVLAANMDQGCLLHFTKIQSSPRPTCLF